MAEGVNVLNKKVGRMLSLIALCIQLKGIEIQPELMFFFLCEMPEKC